MISDISKSKRKVCAESARSQGSHAQARSKPVAMRASAPVGVDRADNLNESRAVDISAGREVWGRSSVAPRDARRCRWVKEHHGDDRVPVALDGDVSTVSCLYTRHIWAAIFNTAYKSDLLSCASVNADIRRREGKCFEERKAME
jgi:hypothetical protein